MNDHLVAGSSQFEMTPQDSQFLFGYPHVERYSTGIHDPLYSSALYLTDGRTQAMMIGNDIIFVGKDLVGRSRQRIEKATGIPAQNIMITATHTHSGPITVDYISKGDDKAVPDADPKYLKFMEDRIVEAAIAAYERARPAEGGLAVANGRGVGTNRRDPKGPADFQVPVLVVRGAEDHEPLACMLVCCMHPTVLHEDSKLVSGDFPGMTRMYLQKNLFRTDCPILYHTGPCGNQSPRHVTKANTFDEAKRLGDLLAKAVEKVIPEIEFSRDLKINVMQAEVELPRKTFPSADQAKQHLDRSVQRLKQLREAGAPSQEVRTAECDWFGAEEMYALARAGQSGALEATYQACLPMEIQIVRIGEWNFVGWQGEIFIEYDLQLKRACDNTFVISCANGELQGYIVTKEAADEGGYEASNAMFDWASGKVIVEATKKLLQG